METQITQKMCNGEREGVQECNFPLLWNSAVCLFVVLFVVF